MVPTCLIDVTSRRHPKQQNSSLEILGGQNCDLNTFKKKEFYALVPAKEDFEDPQM